LGFYDYKKTGAPGSTVVHILALAAIIEVTIIGRRIVRKEVQKPHPTITWVALTKHLR
jgi:ammonia channel protein AmtB